MRSSAYRSLSPDGKWHSKMLSAGAITQPFKEAWRSSDYPATAPRVRTGLRASLSAILREQEYQAQAVSTTHSIDESRAFQSSLLGARSIRHQYSRVSGRRGCKVTRAFRPVTRSTKVITSRTE